MIFISKGILKEKGIFEGISKKTGNPFKMYNLYFEDNGLMTKVTANEMMFNKAEKGKLYELKAKVKDFGNIELNDIELAKN